MPDISELLQGEVSRLRDIATKSGDFRLSAMLIAASDENVQSILSTQLSIGHGYIGALVLVAGDVCHIVFQFSRAEDLFGLMPLSTLVTVNVTERRLVAVVENYLLPASPSAMQPRLDLTALMRESFSPPTRRPPNKTVWSNLSHWV